MITSSMVSQYLDAIKRIEDGLGTDHADLLWAMKELLNLLGNLISFLEVQGDDGDDLE